MKRNEMHHIGPEETRVQRVQRELDRLHAFRIVFLLFGRYNSKDWRVRMALRINLFGVYVIGIYTA